MHISLFDVIVGRLRLFMKSEEKFDQLIGMVCCSMHQGLLYAYLQELTCGTNGALCGAQGRLHNVKGVTTPESAAIFCVINFASGKILFAISITFSKWYYE